MKSNDMKRAYVVRPYKWVILLLFLCTPFLLHAEDTVSPLFLSDLKNPNDFSSFANGGWDGNWYIGYNTCWIQKIPVPEKGPYQKAFLGAKIGRMKHQLSPGKSPWERTPIPGKIYIGVSPTPAWNRKQSFFLVKSEDIPLEADFENAIEGVGNAEWFWREIPLNKIRFGADNYLALWSVTPEFKDVSNSPILAAGWGNKEINSWLNNDIKGSPPKNASDSLTTPITLFEPAIALKLVPAPPEGLSPEVSIIKIETGEKAGKVPAPRVVWVEAGGVSIGRVWVELSMDKKKWTRYGRFQYQAPFVFSLKTHAIPIGSDGQTWVRAGATDLFETTTYSEPKAVFEREP